MLQGLLFGCGGEHGEHCDLALAVEVQQFEHFAPEVAVRVRRGTLRSSACSGGQAGITLILSLLFGSGRGGGTADIKSNNANLTGGEISKKCGHITYSYGHLLLITGHK